MADHQLHLAASDGRLRRNEYRVLVTLHGLLDWREFRQAKVILVARRCGLWKGKVAESLQRLWEFGYIEAGPTMEGIRTYRLTMPAIPGAAVATSRHPPG